MGYGFDFKGRLCCDSCGVSGGVRKRPCKYKVAYPDGSMLNYCYAPALCSKCYAAKGGLNGVHGDSCREGAHESQQEQDHIRFQLAKGDSLVRAAWGDWHDKVPTGWTGVMFRGLEAVGTTYALVPAEDYAPNVRQFLSNYPTTRLWADHA